MGDVVTNSRSVIVEEVEERAPLLCSNYAMDLDTTIRVRAGQTLIVYSHDDGHYRYDICVYLVKGH